MSEPIGPDASSHAAQQRQRASQLAQAIRVELQKAVIGQDSVIRYAEVNPDYTQRPEPSAMLDALTR